MLGPGQRAQPKEEVSVPGRDGERLEPLIFEMEKPH